MIPGEDLRAAQEQVARLERELIALKDKRPISRRSWVAITVIGNFLGTLIWRQVIPMRVVKPAPVVTPAERYKDVTCWRIVFDWQMFGDDYKAVGFYSTPQAPATERFETDDAARIWLRAWHQKECAPEWKVTP